MLSCQNGNEISHSGTSFWLSEDDVQNPLHYFKRISKPFKGATDVVIIGGGITGVFLAYWLIRSGQNVTLIERRQISGGASGRNGGHLWPVASDSTVELFERVGAKRAADVYRFAYNSTDSLKKFIKENNVPCQLTERGGVELGSSEEEYQSLIRGEALLKAAGIDRGIVPMTKEQILEKFNIPFASSSSSSSSTPLPPSHTPHTGTPVSGASPKAFHFGGIYDPNACQLWPAKLVRSVLAMAEQEAKERGLVLDILSKTCVVRIDRSHDGLEENEKAHSLTIHTDQLDRIAATHVCHCTDGYGSSPSLLPSFWSSLVRPIRGQVIVTEPFEPPFSIGSLSTNGSYEYMIHRSEDRRIVIGGMEHVVAGGQEDLSDDSVTVPVITEKLHGLLKHIVSGTPRIDYEWSGIMGYSPDRMPLVGSIPGQEKEWMAIGTSGCGMPYVWGIARCLASKVSGVSNADFHPEFPLHLPSVYGPERFLKYLEYKKVFHLPKNYIHH